MTTSSSKPTILIQLDTDPQPSVFDGVVAVDAGVDHLFSHGGVTPENVRDLVYGALFTRGPTDLHRTALFIGGSKVSAAEAVLDTVRETFFGPFQVSVLFDANGSNTTAAAAVLAALEGHGGSLEGARAVTLAATGPVGQRIARLLSQLGATVAMGSRDIARARLHANRIHEITNGTVTPFSTSSIEAIAAELETATIVINSGPAGVQILPASLRQKAPHLKVAIDLNAVPPLGIEGVVATDKDVNQSGVRCWGAIGVGGTKMKIHKKAIQELFTSNRLILDAVEVLELGRRLD